MHRRSLASSRASEVPRPNNILPRGTWPPHTAFLFHVDTVSLSPAASTDHRQQKQQQQQQQATTTTMTDDWYSSMAINASHAYLPLFVSRPYGNGLKIIPFNKS